MVMVVTHGPDVVEIQPTVAIIILRMRNTNLNLKVNLMSESNINNHSVVVIVVDTVVEAPNVLDDICNIHLNKLKLL